MPLAGANIFRFMVEGDTISAASAFQMFTRHQNTKILPLNLPRLLHEYCMRVGTVGRKVNFLHCPSVCSHSSDHRPL